jgi:hypothetical protein
MQTYSHFLRIKTPNYRKIPVNLYANNEKGFIKFIGWHPFRYHCNHQGKHFEKHGRVIMKRQIIRSIPVLLTLLVVFLGLELTGCGAPSALASSGAVKKQETSIPTKPAGTMTQTAGLSPTAILSPLPTVTLEDAQTQVGRLMQTNNHCQLPCWWGITPGRTTWKDAVNILAPLAAANIEADIKQDPAIISVTIHAPTPEHGAALLQNYGIAGGVVERIDVYNFDFAPFTYFKQFVQEHGIPDEIYLRGYQDVGFEIALFYPEKGILAVYSHTAEPNGKNLKACFDGAESPYLYLWSADQPMSFDEAQSAFHLQIQDLPAYRPIKDNINNFDEFKNSLMELESPSCLQTPTVLWPSRG